MVEQRDTGSGYSHTQRGPLCLILYAAAAGALAIGAATGETAGILAAGGAAAAIAALGPSFHYLRVEDEGDALSIAFGPLPLFRRTLRYADLLSAEVGRTTLLDGWGIHASPRGGWVWNLWGRDCVVLQTAQGRLCIGTDDATNLASFLQAKCARR